MENTLWNGLDVCAELASLFGFNYKIEYTVNNQGN